MSERRSMPPLPAQQLDPRNAAGAQVGVRGDPRNTVGSGSTNPTDVGLARLNMPYRLYSGPGITATYAGTGVGLMLDLTTVPVGDSVNAEDRWIPVWDESSLETRKLPMLGGGTVNPHIHPESDVINLVPDLALRLQDAPGSLAHDNLTYARKNGGWDAIVTETIEWGDIIGIPPTMPPSPHTHPISDVVGLQGELDLIEADQVTQDNAILANSNALLTKEDKVNKAVPDGYASLDGGGKVPAAQLPSYVDDIVEYANLAAFPATGETGKIYVALDTNKLYRWSGSAYVEVSAGNIDVYTRAESDTRYVNVTGDTLTGFLTAHADPSTTMHVATKQYVDNKVGTVPAGATISDTPPAGAVSGQFWLESDSGTLFVYWADPNSSQWVDVSGSSALGNYLPLAGGTLTGDLGITKANPSLVLTKAASGQDVSILACTGANSRWGFQMGNGVAESGSNAGSDFALNRYSDAGAWLGAALSVTRATGNATFGGNVGAINVTASTNVTASSAVVGTYIICGHGSQGYQLTNVAGIGATNTAGLVTEGPDVPLYANKIGANGYAVAICQGMNVCGSISVANGNSTAFNTASDGRLKDDGRDFDAGPIIDAINVYDFQWKGQENRGHGIIAQEVVEVFDEAIFYDKETDWWGVDYSKFVPLLLQEMKILRARVAELEAR